MAGVSDKQLYRAGPWPLGIDNQTRQENALPVDEDGNRVALREATNVDLDAQGWPSRRPGAAKILAGTLAHSLWSDDRITFGLWASDGQLKALLPGQTAQALGADVGNLPLSYTLINDRVYFSNRVACGLVDLQMQVWPWAPEQPGGQPLLAAVDGLSLYAGQYQVAITFSDALGRESGSTRAAAIQVGAGQGIALTAIPQPADANTLQVNVYLTAPDGKVPRLYARLPVGVTAATISQAAEGPPLDTISQAAGGPLDILMLQAMPPGQLVAGGHGRLWVARGREVLWSPALRYGLWDPVSARMGYQADVDLLAPVGDGTAGAGLYVAAHRRVYWHAGAKPEDFTQAIVAHDGVVPGSAIFVPGDVLGLDSTAPVPVWLSRNGKHCIGLPGGQVVPIKNNALVDDADRAAVLLRRQGGQSQLVTALRGPQEQAAAARDYAVVHLIDTTP